MAALVATEVPDVEDVHRILHSLVEDSRRLERTDERPLLLANAIAIRYWQSVLEDRLRSAGRP